MIYCTNCGTQLEESCIFCSKCGGRVKKTENDYSIYAPNVEKINAYRPCVDNERNNKAIIQFIGCLIIGVLLYFLFYPKGFLFFLLMVFVSFCVLFTAKKRKRMKIYKKQINKIKYGMDINEVRAIMAFIKPMEEGLNRNNEYCILYSTNIERKNKVDYESALMIFDSNARLISCEKSYKRTKYR